MSAIMTQDEINKIQRKIPRWFKNTKQINSTILIKYLENTQKGNYLEIEKLENLCSSVKTFRSNFDQMCILGEKNNALIFEKQGNLVRLIPSIRAYIIDQYEIHLKSRS